MVAMGLYSTSIFQGSRTPSFRDFALRQSLLDILDYSGLYEIWQCIDPRVEACFYSWHQVRDTASHFLSDVLGCNLIDIDGNEESQTLTNRTPDPYMIAFCRTIINSFSDKYLLKYGRKIGMSLYYSIISSKKPDFLMKSLEQEVAAQMSEHAGSKLEILSLFEESNKRISILIGEYSLTDTPHPQQLQAAGDLARATSIDEFSSSGPRSISTLFVDFIANLISCID